MRENPQEETPTYPLTQSAAFAGSTFVTMGLVDLVAHLGPTGLLVGGLASYVAWKHGPELYASVRRRLPSSQTSPEHADQEEQQSRHQGGRSFLDRALGRYPETLEEDGQEEETTRQPKDAPDPLSRVTTARGASDAPRSSLIPRQFTLGGDTLTAVKDVNTQRYVYFGRTATRQVVINIDVMYHVLDVAKSGRGKSNRFRNGMMQVVGLADTYYLNPFAAPVKSVTDARRIEVWQPIYDRLANGHPVRESAEILQVLTRLLREIERRSDQEQRRDFSWRAKPVFVFIDEVPEIFARCPEAVKLLDRIGRGGRQFGIFAWIASQSALVSHIGLSTACQAQFKTLNYGGGDRLSANRVMGKVTPEQEEVLRTNGPGLTLMKADGVDDTEYVRSPLITNEALFAYFGLPPFQMDEWVAPMSRQPVQDLSPFHAFTPDGKHAQNTRVEGVKGQERERRERVKGPNDEAILDALSALEEEEKPLTLNAITRKAGLTWRQAEEIEEVAYWFGYELDRGKGRPAKEG
jgi:hypothetical protein